MAPGYDRNNPKILKETPKKAMIHPTHVYNTALRMEYVPKQWKRSQVITLFKPRKSSKLVTLCSPISFLLGISKLFEKLLLRRFKQFLVQKQLIPEHQFGVQNKHLNTDRVNRKTNVISESFQESNYCHGVFLNVAQPCNKV